MVQIVRFQKNPHQNGRPPLLENEEKMLKISVISTTEPIEPKYEI